MTNVSDTKALRLAAKAARQAEADREHVLVSILATPAGRAFMHDRLARAHMFSSSFTPDPYRTAFAEGERNIGLQDLADITRICPDQYVQMMREANDKDRANDRRNDSSRGDSRSDSGPRGNGGGYYATDYDPYRNGDDTADGADGGPGEA